MTEKREPNPNATIQLDAAAADDVVLDSTPSLENAADAEASASSPPARRVTPPPLPPQPPVVASVAPPPPKNRNLIYGVAFVVLLALVIGLGVKVGGSLRPSAPAATVASAAPAATPTVVATTPATKQTITIRTIEMNDQPDGG